MSIKNISEYKTLTLRKNFHFSFLFIRIIPTTALHWFLSLPNPEHQW